MTEQTKATRKKRPDAAKVAEERRKKEAIDLANEVGITVNEDWTAERIEAAVEKALETEENAPPPAKEAAPVEVDEDDPVRVEILAEAAKVGMNLTDLEGKDNETVLSLIGSHVQENALRQAAALEDAGKVTVRVTKKGDGKLSKGIHVPGVGDLTHPAGAELRMGKAVAEELEERGFVEIQDA